MTDRICHHGFPSMECRLCLEVRGVAFKVTDFWTKVDQSAGPDGCWPWMGYQEHGYGRFHWGGRMVGAHELALTFATGEPRHPDLDTCHACGVPICCNPQHLRFDTRASNVADMLRHGTHVPGRKKLSDEQVVAIRQRAALGARGVDLAADFGVSPSLINEITRGRKRAGAGGPIRTQDDRTHGRYARNKKGNAA